MDCGEITTIRLDQLACQPCADRRREGIQDLMAAAGFDGDLGNQADREAHNAKVVAEWDADARAAHAEWLGENTARLLTFFRKLSRADRDHILTAITKGLLEAR